MKSSSPYVFHIFVSGRESLNDSQICPNTMFSPLFTAFPHLELLLLALFMFHMYGKGWNQEFFVQEEPTPGRDWYL